MNMTDVKPNVVFFSRAYQSKFFPLLKSTNYNSIHVTLIKSEKKYLKQNGCEVEYCFEEYNKLAPLPIPAHYLETSFFADRFLNHLNIEKRNLFLRKEIAFWAEIYDKYNPIAVFNELVAIEISEVMYIEAKNRNIAYKAWMNHPIKGYFYWLSNPMSLILDEKVFNKKPSDDSIKQAKLYLEKIRIKNERPYYLIPFLNKKKLRSLLSSIKSYLKTNISELLNSKDDNLKYEIHSQYYKEALMRNFNVYFHKYDDIKDLKDKEIILYPLHFEPEASLLYLSEFYSNQIALIENISKCLGHNQVLIVKEHPAQAGMLVTRNYRELRKNISNIYYLPHTIISYDIIKISKLIVTLTSHLGWEALILDKPVFLLGKMFYYSYPKINKFEGFDDLRQKIKNNDFLYPDEKTLVKFIAQLLDYSYKGMPFPGDKLYSRENINNITFALEEEIKKLMD
jgi:hypothetical protein